MLCFIIIIIIIIITTFFKEFVLVCARLSEISVSFVILLFFKKKIYKRESFYDERNLRYQFIVSLLFLTLRVIQSDRYLLHNQLCDINCAKDKRNQFLFVATL
jgi:hypothetical protein